jgi:hypothetical protein
MVWRRAADSRLLRLRVVLVPLSGIYSKDAGQSLEHAHITIDSDADVQGDGIGSIDLI